jgi:hypothetical protein
MIGVLATYYFCHLILLSPLTARHGWSRSHKGAGRSTERLRAAFRTNYEPLVDVKAMHDPTDFFIKQPLFFRDLPEVANPV